MKTENFFTTKPPKFEYDDLHIGSCPPQSLQCRLEGLWLSCGPLLETLNDIFVDTDQNLHPADSQRKIDIQTLITVLGRLEPFLHPGLVSQCLEFLSLDVQA